MKRRIRKKLRKKEFQELGFIVMFSYLPDIEEEVVWKVICHFDSLGMSMGGGGSSVHSDWFVSPSYKTPMTYRQRLEFVADARKQWEIYLESLDEVLTFSIGQPEDAWHPSKKDDDDYKVHLNKMLSSTLPKVVSEELNRMLNRTLV